MTRSPARWLFSAFWGLLCTSAAQQALHNCTEGLWGKVVLGLLFTAWTGCNSYLWATKPGRRGPQEQ